MVRSFVALSMVTVIAAIVSLTAWAGPANGAPLNDLSWSAGTTIPNAHQETASAKVNNKIYVISGAALSCSDSGPSPITTAVDIYDTVSNTFTVGPSVNLGRTEYPLAATIGNSVFLIGGTNPCLGATVAPVEKLDLATNTWTILPATANLPAPLDGAEHCGAVHANQIYYIQAAGIGVFDTTTNTWTVLPADPLLSPSSFCQATTVGDTIVITGPGDGGPGPNSQRILVFDIDTGTISLLSSTTVPLAEHTSARLRGRVVVAGGDFAPTTVQAIFHDSVSTLSPLPDPRDDAVGGVVGDRYFILGGNNGVTNLPPVLIGTP